MFPSPCGDVVLKWLSPYGDSVADILFPSPCGDVVLKYRTLRTYRRVHHEVSVPLRGCGFEILPPSCLEQYASTSVSVPLRGCGFEIFYRTRDLLARSKFPSPCGDVVLKSLRLEALCRVAQNSILRRGSDSPPLCYGNLF